MSEADHFKFDGVTPILRVADLSRSIDYYVGKLGFTLNWRHESGFGSVSNGRCSLFLCVGDQGHPGTWVWIGVPDAQALYEHYRLSGVKVRQRPTNFEWALEMQVEDLDGNILRLGSDPIDNEPRGEWLDMYGDSWVKTQEGTFQKLPQPS